MSIDGASPFNDDSFSRMLFKSEEAIWGAFGSELQRIADNAIL